MTTPQEALALHTAGRTTDALVMLFNAIGAAPAASPAVAEHRALLASLLEGVALTSGNAVVFFGVQELLRDPRIDPQSVARAVLGLLGVHGAFALLEQEAGSDAAPGTPAALEALLGEPLVRLALRRIVVSDARAERIFAFARRSLLLLTANGVTTAWRRDAMITLAMAAHAGEYAWSPHPDELALVHDAVVTLTDWLAAPAGAPRDAGAAAPALVRVAMYRRLIDLPGAHRLRDVPADAWGADWRDLLPPLFTTQLHEPLQQRQLAQGVPTFHGHQSSASTNGVSALVRDMYEAHPYPRWSTVGPPHQTSVPVFVRALTGSSAVPNTRRVLIAGCGTGRQAAHTALSFPDAHITALDLSRTSLGYAAFKAQALGLTNVSFVQGDLLQLDDLEESFALIFCSGVLHHLADPLAGWRQLIARLHPRGVMKIALYSTLARRPVAAARAIVAEQRFAPTDDGLRACRAHLLALPADHPARAVTESTDFYSLSGCRDLLMHVQERSYTLEELARDLDTLGLRFLDFQLPAAVRAAFTAYAPRASANDLAAWARFEEAHPTTFWGMYQFFVTPRAP